MTTELEPDARRQPVPEQQPSTSVPPAGHRLRAGLVRVSLLIVWLVMAVVFAGIEPSHFLSVATLQTILGSQLPLVFVVLGMVFTFSVGEFDLSAPFVLGLAATIVPVLAVVDHQSLAVAIVVAMAASVAVGVVNGFIIVVLEVDPVVATLGMGTFLEGISLAVANLTSVSGLSASFASVVNTKFLAIPLSFYYGLAVTLLAAYVMSFTALGRHMVFTGANREVSRLAGIRTRRIRFGAFVVSALVCGAGGVLLAGGIGGYDPNSSTNYLLPVFSALFLGTTAIYPGRFNPIGAFLAVYFLETGIIGLELLGYGGWVTDVFYGAALVVAVILATRLLPKVIGIRLRGSRSST